MPKSLHASIQPPLTEVDGALGFSRQLCQQRLLHRVAHHAIILPIAADQHVNLELDIIWVQWAGFICHRKALHGFRLGVAGEEDAVAERGSCRDDLDGEHQLPVPVV